MIDFKNADLFLKSDTKKEILIEYSGGTITNSELHQNTFSLEESLCSEESLRFGACEASILKFTVHNTVISFKNEWIDVSVILNGNTSEPFEIGHYKVYSDIPTADRKKRNVVAYDALYDILQAEVSDWYNDLLPEETSTVTLKEFRNSFFEYVGVEQQEITLVNDSMTVAKTIQPEQLSGKTVINCICEINGCFGHIGRNGKFQYVILQKHVEALYPAVDLYPADDLFPRKETGMTRIKSGHYKKCEYEDFVTKPVTSILIRKEENDIGVQIYDDAVVLTAGENVFASDSLLCGQSIMGNYNVYIIQDNFLLYGKGIEELENIAWNMYSVIKEITYMPMTVSAIGNPCFEVGDGVKVITKTKIIRSYVLERTLSSVMAMSDRYGSNGVEEYSEKVNSVRESIIQLKGKSNKLTRTIEETRIEMEDIEQGLLSTISITAGQIRTELQNTKSGLESSISQTASQIRSEVADVENDLNSSISQTATQIRTEVSNVKSGLESQITQTATQIRSEVSDSNQGLQSQITQNAGRITSEVTRATNAENQLSTKITQTDEKIRTDVAATYETIDVVEEKVNSAVSESNDYTDTKLVMYSTTSQMNSAIEQSAGNINLSVDSKIQTTKEYIDDSLGSYSTTEQVQSKIDLSKDGILASVSSTYETKSNAEYSYEELESKIQLNANRIALKVSSSTAQSMIDVSLEELVLSSSQIRLEGYTTINGGFSVDTDGNVTLSDDSGWYYAKMTSTGLVVTYDNPNYSGTYYTKISDGTIGLKDPWDTKILAYMNNGKLYISCDRLEVESRATINGYTVIHSGNIDDYVDISELEASISNLETVVDDNLWFTVETLNEFSARLDELENRIG